MAHMRHWASPITLEDMDDMGCDLLEQKLRHVGISKIQVRRKTFVPFLIEIVRLTITDEKKNRFFNL